MNDFYAREFWRFVLVQQRVAALAQTTVDVHPCRRPPRSTLAVRRVEEKLGRTKGNLRLSRGLSTSQGMALARGSDGARAYPRRVNGSSPAER